MIETHVHPQIKILTLTLRVAHNMHFSVHRIITPFNYHDISLSKVSYAKKKDMRYAKKKKENPCRGAWERKNGQVSKRIKQWALRCPPEKKEREKEKK
jgi:hypothetical protein